MYPVDFESCLFHFDGRTFAEWFLAMCLRVQSILFLKFSPRQVVDNASSKRIAEHIDRCPDAVAVNANETTNCWSLIYLVEDAHAYELF